jgi:hypothetical protein
MTIWKDRSGNGYNATPSGSPTYSDGGVVFNGTSQYFNLPNGALPSGNSPYSYYAVIKPTDLSGVGIIGGGADTTTFGQFALEYTKTNTFLLAFVNTDPNFNCCAYSLDGTTWSLSPSAETIFLNGVISIAYNGTTWVAGGTYGSTSIGYSSDGVIWKQAYGNGWTTTYSIAVNGSIWVAGGGSPEGGNTMAYSSDGISWTQSASGYAIFPAFCSAVATNGSLWVAAGDGGANRFAYSSNGINWLPDLSGNGIFTTRCYTIATNGTIWVAGGSGTNQLVYSSDRITWTASTSGNAVITTQCTSVAWN